MRAYLGIDVGSVSTNLVVIDDDYNVLANLYIRTNGRPIKAVQDGMMELKGELPEDIEIAGVGTTGSGRYLTAVLVGADIIKNEIIAHAVATSHLIPDVRTIIEIGGQDSKIIILKDGIVVDFAMNTVCAAGTGSFLDHQAARLCIPIEEFGEIAVKSKNPVRIAGRCAVFAESDMIHKQQLGYAMEDIIAGLCEALVRNYINNVGKGKDIQPPIAFQGGVAANIGIRRAFEKELGCEVLVPKYFNVMGALGAAILAKDTSGTREKTNFKGFEIGEFNYRAGGFECKLCSNNCEIVQIFKDDKIIARWGGRCGRWDIV